MILLRSVIQRLQRSVCVLQKQRGRVRLQSRNGLRRESEMPNEQGVQSPQEDLAIIRKLLMFALIRSGVSQDELAGVLGISQPSISRMLGRASKPNRAKAKR